VSPKGSQGRAAEPTIKLVENGGSGGSGGAVENENAPAAISGTQSRDVNNNRMEEDNQKQSPGAQFGRGAERADGDTVEGDDKGGVGNSGQAPSRPQETTSERSASDDKEGSSGASYRGVVPLPDEQGWKFCAREKEKCLFEGTRSVRIGNVETWIEDTLTGPVLCTLSIFTDDPQSYAAATSGEGGLYCYYHDSIAPARTQAADSSRTFQGIHGPETIQSAAASASPKDTRPSSRERSPNPSPEASPQTSARNLTASGKDSGAGETAATAEDAEKDSSRSDETTEAQTIGGKNLHSGSPPVTAVGAISEQQGDEISTDGAKAGSGAIGARGSVIAGGTASAQSRKRLQGGTPMQILTKKVKMLEMDLTETKFDVQELRNDMDHIEKLKKSQTSEILILSNALRKALDDLSRLNDTTVSQKELIEALQGLANQDSAYWEQIWTVFGILSTLNLLLLIVAWNYQSLTPPSDENFAGRRRASDPLNLRTRDLQNKLHRRSFSVGALRNPEKRRPLPFNGDSFENPTFGNIIVTKSAVENEDATRNGSTPPKRSKSPVSTPLRSLLPGPGATTGNELKNGTPLMASPGPSIRDSESERDEADQTYSSQLEGRKEETRMGNEGESKVWDGECEAEAEAAESQGYDENEMELERNVRPLMRGIYVLLDIYNALVYIVDMALWTLLIFSITWLLVEIPQARDLAEVLGASKVEEIKDAANVQDASFREC